jgi:DNA-binding PadR family transcriptional regulator
MFELTKFQRDLLIILAGLDEPNGLEVKAEMEDYYVAEVNHGRLYPNLDTLVEQGLISKTKKDERTNSYELTEEGKTMIEDRRDWENQYYNFE